MSAPETSPTVEKKMETAKSVDKAPTPASPGADNKPEQKIKRKRTNPTQGLLRAKKKLDEARHHLAPYPDLSEEVGNIRGKVFQRFIEEEETSISR